LHEGQRPSLGWVIMQQPTPSERVYMTGLPEGVDQAKLLQIFGAYGTIKDSAQISATAAILKFATLEEATWFVNNLNGNMPEGLTTPVTVQFARPPRAARDVAGSKAWPAITTSVGGVNRAVNRGVSSGWAAKTSSIGGVSWSAGPYGNKSSTAKGTGAQAKAYSTSPVQLLKTALESSGALPGGQAGKGERPETQQLYISGLPPDTKDGDLYDLFGPFGAIPFRGVKAMLGPNGQCIGIGFVDYLDEACAARAVQVLNGTVLPDGTQLHLHQKSVGKGFGK